MNRPNSTIPDRELVELVVRDGDETAFRLLYRRHAPGLTAFLRRCAPGADADDISARWSKPSSAAPQAIRGRRASPKRHPDHALPVRLVPHVPLGLRAPEDGVHDPVGQLVLQIVEDLRDRAGSPAPRGRSLQPGPRMGGQESGDGPRGSHCLRDEARRRHHQGRSAKSRSAFVRPLAGDRRHSLPLRRARPSALPAIAIPREGR